MLKLFSECGLMFFHNTDIIILEHQKKFIGGKMRLGSLIETKVGLNTRELKKMSNVTYYLKKFADNDLLLGYRPNSSKVSCNDEFVTAGDIVINSTTNEATIVSPLNEGKILTQASIKIIIRDPQQLDLWYLCYLFNGSQIIKKQIYSLVEGTVLRRITQSNIQDLDIPVISLEEQKRIGESYRIFMVRKRLRIHREEEEQKAIFNFLEKKITYVKKRNKDEY